LQKASGATLFNTVLAAWAALLYRYGQGEELVVGTPFANRTHQEMAGVIGHWASMLILPVRFQENPTFLTLIQQVNQATQTAMTNDVPIDQLVGALPPARKRNNLPHQFLIRYLQGNMTLDLQPAGISVIPLENKTSTLRPDLALTVFEENSADGLRLVGEWEYKVELFEERSIQCMIEDFRSLLDAVLADPTCSINNVLLPNLVRTEANSG
jgi:non-ribosomal peptide synthetase component F